MPLDIEFYGNIVARMHYGSVEYYLSAGVSERQFNGDTELKEAFTEVRTALDRFVDLLYERIEEAGGDPERYVDRGTEAAKR